MFSGCNIMFLYFSSAMAYTHSLANTPSNGATNETTMRWQRRRPCHLRRHVLAPALCQSTNRNIVQSIFKWSWWANSMKFLSEWYSVLFARSDVSLIFIFSFLLAHFILFSFFGLRFFLSFFSLSLTCCCHCIRCVCWLSYGVFGILVLLLPVCKSMSTLKYRQLFTSPLVRWIDRKWANEASTMSTE